MGYIFFLVNVYLKNNARLLQNANFITATYYTIEDQVFVISGIIKVEVSQCYQPTPKAEADSSY